MADVGRPECKEGGPWPARACAQRTPEERWWNARIAEMQRRAGENVEAKLAAARPAKEAAKQAVQAVQEEQPSKTRRRRAREPILAPPPALEHQHDYGRIVKDGSGMAKLKSALDARGCKFDRRSILRARP